VLAQRLVFPYACMAALLFAIMVFIHFSSLREIPPELDAADGRVDATSVLQFPQLVLGALALFGLCRRGGDRRRHHRPVRPRTEGRAILAC
jgi:fucose permease